MMKKKRKVKRVKRAKRARSKESRRSRKHKSPLTLMMESIFQHPPLSNCEKMWRMMSSKKMIMKETDSEPANLGKEPSKTQAFLSSKLMEEPLKPRSRKSMHMDTALKTAETTSNSLQMTRSPTTLQGWES